MTHFQFLLEHTRSMGSRWWDGAAMCEGQGYAGDTVRDRGPSSVLLPPVSPWAALSWPSPHAVQVCLIQAVVKEGEEQSRPGEQVLCSWLSSRRRRTPRPALPRNLAREQHAPELIHPACFGGCFCARCPLCWCSLRTTDWLFPIASCLHRPSSSSLALPSLPSACLLL